MRNWLKFAHTSLLLVLLANCTHSEKEKDKFVEPEWSNTNAVEIFATGNFNGTLESKARAFHKLEKEPIRYGGAELLLAYRKIIQQRLPKQHLFLDAGDFFAGQADIIHHTATAQLLKRLAYDAVLFGPQEIQALGNPPLAQGIPFINSHLFDLTTGKAYRNENILATRIVNTAGKKIGIIAIDDEGLATNKKILGLYFEDSVLGILRHKNELQKAGVDAIILLAKINTACHLSSNTNLSCAKDDRLYKLLSRMPPKTVDLVITNSPSMETGKIFQTTILFAPKPGQGQWLSRARLEFSDNNSVQVSLLPPLSICDRFFHASGDCHHPFDTNLINEKRAAKFWGYEIAPDRSFAEELKLIRTQGSPSPANKSF